MLEFLMTPFACGLSALFGALVAWRVTKRKYKTDRDLHLKARVKTDEAHDRLRGKYIILIGMYDSLKKGE